LNVCSLKGTGREDSGEVSKIGNVFMKALV